MKVFRLPLLALSLAFLPHTATAETKPAFAVTQEEEFFNLLDLDKPELATLRTAVEKRDWKAAKQAWALHLSHRTNPRWLWSRRDRQAFMEVYRKDFGGLERHIESADKVLARDFELLGVRKQLSPKVEWLQGPIEWTHVLSRFGYWRSTGLAYWGTGKAAYARDFVDHLTHWIESNPVPGKVSNDRGKNGSVWRTLEAGIRGQDWFETMEFFMDAPEFDAEAKFLMTRSLVEHAGYLEAWLTVFRRGNWQVCEASGLATIGLMLPEFKESAAWRDRGFRFLVEHMEKDVLADGAHSELTPGYHTWVMNQFTAVSQLGLKNGVALPKLLEKHEKMFDFLQALSRPDGRLPAVGDTGTGSGFKGSMGLGAMIYQRPDFRHLADTVRDENWLWLFGPEAGKKVAALQSEPPDFTSVLLPAAQYAVMRGGWSSDDSYLLFDAAPWGGGHSHQDRLQVTVFAGRDLLIDSGMCSYDQPEAAGLRKTASHNVVMIDGEEQLNVDPELLAWHTGPQADFASGRIEKDGVSHQRSVLFVKPDYWVVVDHLEGEGEHEVTRLFHFPARSGAKAMGNAAQTAFANGMNIRVQPVDMADLEMRTGTISGGNMTNTTDAPVAAFVSKGKFPMTLCTVLLPYADAKSIPQVKLMPSADTRIQQVRLEFPDGRLDEIAIAARATALKIGTHQARTPALLVRENQAIVIPPGIGKER